VAAPDRLASITRREWANGHDAPSAAPKEALCEAAEIASGRDASADLCS
jgi:hypothetical protein